MGVSKEYKLQLKAYLDGKEAEAEIKKLTDNTQGFISTLKNVPSMKSVLKMDNSLFKDVKKIASVYSEAISKESAFLNQAVSHTSILNQKLNSATAAAKEFAKVSSEAAKESKKAIDSANKLQTGGSGEQGGRGSFIGDAARALKARTGVYLSYRAINEVAQGAKALATSTVELESAFANIQAITSSTDTTMDKLKNTILRVGEASKYSVEEIAQATTQLGQAGLSAEEINSVLETTTQLAAATGSSLSNTVDLMTSALAVWGLNAEEATHLSDVMVTGMNKTKATLETFRMAVQYAGATMASLNVNFDEFGAVAAAAANAGLRASVVGTGLRGVVSELISPTTKMKKGLAELGLTTEDVDVSAKGLVNVLKTLKDAGLDASNAYSLFGRRAAQFSLAAVGQLDVVDNLQLAFAESGSTMKAYSTQMDTLASQWTALTNTVKEAAYDLSQSTRGVLNDLVSWMNSTIRAMVKDSADLIMEERKIFEDAYQSASRYSDVLEGFMRKDYKGNSVDAIADLNKLIESVNKRFGQTIDFVQPTENLAEAYGKVAQALRDIREEQNDMKNLNVYESRGAILAEGRRSAALQGIRYGNKWDVSSYKDVFDESVLRYEQLLREDQSSESAIKTEIDNVRKEGNKLGASILQSSLETAKRLIAEGGEITDIQSEEDKKAITSAFAEIGKNINVNLEKLLVTDENSVNKLTAGAITTERDKIEAQLGNILGALDGSEVDIEELKKELNELIYDKNGEIKEGLEANYVALVQQMIANLDNVQNKTLDTETKNKIIDGLGQLQNALGQNLISFMNKLKALFTEKGEMSKVEELSKVIKKESPQALVDQMTEDAKEAKRRQREADRAAREADRLRRKAINDRLQRFSLQYAADSYSTNVAKATREGITSRINYIDKTGISGSAYSSASSEISRLEDLKVALRNKETLENYKKEYGDLYEQVNVGKITLSEADEKSDKVISKMLELDKSIAKAEGEFGKLNQVNLDDVNEQLDKLDKTSKEIAKNSETAWGRFENGFRITIDNMKKQYSEASLGKLVAEDLADGMSDALWSIADKSKSVKEAFSDMARSILQDISKMLIKMAVLNAMSPLGFDFGTPQMSNGGVVRAAAGSPVRGGIPYRDSVPAKLMPGEYVLKKSAVDALGTNFLNDLNNNASQTLLKTASSLTSYEPKNNESGEASVVNVWVVSKEEEAQMGPSDVIATISKDIMTGGTTRKLIQSVVMGRK